MPNPFHDPEGKFTSRSDLSDRVKNAESSGDFDSYLKERTNLESIERKIAASKNPHIELERNLQTLQKSKRQQIAVEAGSAENKTNIFSSKLHAEKFVDKVSEISGFDPENLTAEDEAKLTELFQTATAEGVDRRQADKSEQNNFFLTLNEMREKVWEQEIANISMFDHFTDEVKQTSKELLIKNLTDQYNQGYSSKTR